MEMRHEVFFFFFSSRRRHTRYWRDWSSDVCSSDLIHPRNGRELYFVSFELKIMESKSPKDLRIFNLDLKLKILIKKTKRV